MRAARVGEGGGVPRAGPARAASSVFKFRCARAHLLTARPLMAGAGVQAQAAPVESKASAATLLAVFMAAPSLQLRLHWLYIFNALHL